MWQRPFISINVSMGCLLVRIETTATVPTTPMAMATGWQIDFYNNWEEGSPSTIFHDKPFSAGNCRYAYRAKYTKFHHSRSHGEKAIVKKLRDFRCWQREDWDQETKLAQKAKELVGNWNATNSVTKRYIIHVPEVIRCTRAVTSGDFTVGEWLTLEPYIEGNYEKWNSNSGWSKDDKLSVHAFCHWTYHYSGGEMLLCDAQGVRNGDSYCLTDPAMCSMKKGQYGMTDMGEAGIAQWFRNHECNTYCDSSWKRHYSSTPSIPVVAASSYIWQKEK